MTTPGTKSLSDLALQNNFGELKHAIQKSASSGQLGEIALSHFVQDTRVPQEYRAIGVAALGKVPGPLGSGSILAALQTATGDQEDLICSAIVALVRREGSRETRTFEELLTSQSEAVRSYALQALGATGSGEHWDELMNELENRFREGGTLRFGFGATTGYLLRFSAGREGAVQRVVRLLRDNWSRLDQIERLWVEQTWPKALPDGPSLVELSPPTRNETDRWFSWS